MDTQRLVDAPALLTVLVFLSLSHCLALEVEGRAERHSRRAIVVTETQKIKDGPVMAEYQIAVVTGEMALTTVIVSAAACVQWQNRDDDYLNR